MESEDGEYHLVGGLEHDFFSHILGIIVPTDELIFFRGVGLNHQPVIYQRGFTPPKPTYCGSKPSEKPSVSPGTYVSLT